MRVWGIFFVLFLLAGFLRAQESAHYVHPKKPSLPVRVVKLGSRLSGIKGGIEWHIRKQKFKDKPALPPLRFRRKFELRTDAVQGRRVWTLVPRKNATKTLILYLHGGGYIHNLLGFHWQLIGKLAKETGATIVVPDYPLAPKAKFEEVYTFVRIVYADLLRRYPQHKIVFMGDSAGGGLALGFAQLLRDEGKRNAEHIVLLSPWLDVSCSHPEAPQAEKKDPTLSIAGLKLAGIAYAGEDTQNPKASPLFGDMAGLGKVSIFIGTHDVFIVDCRALQTKLQAAGAAHHFYEYPRMFHAWAVAVFLPEAKSAFKQIAKTIGE